MTNSRSWEERGRTLGESLGAFHALVVCGIDPDATARVAIAIGRAQAAHRRVAVGDLMGDVPAVRALVADDDVHGLVDSFLYGVSLSRIARPVAGNGELYVLPTGSELPDYAHLLRQRRWTRLASGFREIGGLLVLIAPANAPHLTDLVDQVDGAVIVGDQVPAALPVAQVVTILRIETPASRRPKPRGEAAVPFSPATNGSAIPDVAPETAPGFAPERQDRATLTLAGAAGVGLTAVVVLLVFWLATAPLAHKWQARARPPRAPLDSLLGPATPRGRVPIGADPAGARAALRPVNPDDSVQASAYVVKLPAAASAEDAMLKLHADGGTLPAATYALDIIGNSTWYQPLCGAFTGRAGADSLLNDLRNHRVIGPSAGVVVRTPYAWRLDSGVVSDAIPGLLDELSRRALPVYALRQDDGTAWVLVGAFETPAQASREAGSLRAASLVPQLVFRKGRTF